MHQHQKEHDKPKCFLFNDSSAKIDSFLIEMKGEGRGGRGVTKRGRNKGISSLHCKKMERDKMSDSLVTIFSSHPSFF
jgi:hypothetical protein